MKRSLTVAVMAAATLLAGGATTATASESPSPTTESGVSAPDDATPLERVSAYTQPSIVYIETKWTGYVWDKYNKLYLNNGNPFTFTGSCTGFVVNPDGYIATAGHCVDPDEVEFNFAATAAEWALNNAYYQSTELTIEDVLGFNDYVVQDAEGKKKPELKVTAAWAVSAGGVETGKALPARVLKWSPLEQGDGAIIKVEADNLNALPLAEEEPDVMSEIVTVGYPGSVRGVSDASLTPSYKEGSISSMTTIEDGLTSVYEISAPISRGMSGGPAVNLEGEVVGVISFYPAEEAQPFNFVQPIDVTREMLGDAGPENALSEDSQAYRAGLDAYFAGEKETAVEQLGAVVANQPTNDMAKQYLDKAEGLPDPPAEESGSEGGSSMGLIIGIVVGVLVLLAIVALVLLALAKKKKGSSTTSSTPSSHAYGGPPPAGYQGYQPQQGPGPGAATSTAVLTPTALQPGPSAAAPGQSPSSPPPPAPAAPVAPVTADAPAAEPEVDETVFCQNCGAKGEPHQKFCKHCGTAL